LKSMTIVVSSVKTENPRPIGLRKHRIPSAQSIKGATHPVRRRGFVFLKTIKSASPTNGGRHRKQTSPSGSHRKFRSRNFPIEINHLIQEEPPSKSPPEMVITSSKRTFRPKFAFGNSHHNLPLRRRRFQTYFAWLFGSIR